jgi:hypothetical protein
MRIENGRVNLFYDSPISNSLPISVTSDEFVFNQETWSGKNVKTGENTKFFESFKINRFTGDISMSLSSFVDGKKIPETMVSYAGTCVKVDTKKF